MPTKPGGISIFTSNSGRRSSASWTTWNFISAHRGLSRFVPPREPGIPISASTASGWKPCAPGFPRRRILRGRPGGCPETWVKVCEGWSGDERALRQSIFLLVPSPVSRQPSVGRSSRNTGVRVQRGFPRPDLNRFVGFFYTSGSRWERGLRFGTFWRISFLSICF